MSCYNTEKMKREVEQTWPCKAEMYFSIALAKKYTCSHRCVSSRSKKRDWAWLTLYKATLTTRTPLLRVTHAHGCRSVVRAARGQPYIIAPSCLKTIWKLLGCDPSGGWGLWLFGEHHVSQSQLYKLRAHAPRSRYPPQSATACGSLEVECGSLRGAVGARNSVAKSNVHSVMGQL